MYTQTCNIANTFNTFHTHILDLYIYIQVEHIFMEFLTIHSLTYYVHIEVHIYNKA